METDTSIAMLLPKGIVTNTATIYQEVASHPTIPADKIYEYWHVYTTTNKKLQDPTARRLENFWWQVWGSDRRNLSGRTLARIFEDISLGSTVVPLRGPPNRWDGHEAILARLSVMSIPTQARVAQPSGTAASSSQLPSSNSERKKINNSRDAKISNAHFVSPLAQSYERDSDTESSGSTAVTGVDVTDTTSEDQKGKAAHYPQLSAKKTAKSFQSPINGHPSSGLASGVDSQTNTPRNTKSVQQPYGLTKDTRQDTSDSTQRYSKVENGSTSPGSQNIIDRTSKYSESKLSPNGRERIQTAAHGPLGPSHTSLMRRSQSSNSADHAKVSQFNKAPPQPSFRGATASTTRIAAQGTIIEESGNSYGTPSPASSALHDPDYSGYSVPYNSSATSLLDNARFTPTQPSAFASLPLGRTKSQLTLLLERGKERGPG